MIAIEQDIGEQYHFNSIQFPLDHLCGSIYFTKNNLNVIAGSFRSFLGQGLLSGQGKGTEFAADWTTLIATNNGFIPYASAMESGYQNGIAIRKDNKKWSVFLAQSYQKVDSGSSSGLHRTASEIRRKDQISQAIFNGRLAYHFKSSQIGINTLVEEFKNNSVDFHQTVADMAGISRSQAKTINLGLFYGMGKAKLQAELGLSTKAEAEKLDNEAKLWNEKSDQAMHLHHRWAQATTLLQVSIALAAISLLSQNRWLKKAMYVVGSAGVVLGVLAALHL